MNSAPRTPTVRPGPAPARPANPAASTAAASGEAAASIESWLALLRGVLRTSPRDRDAIVEELRDHLGARTRDLLLQGREETAAAAIAIRELGDAAGVARQYQREDSRIRRRTMIAYGAVLTVAGAAAVLSVTALNQSGGHQRVKAEIFQEPAAERAHPHALADQPFAPREAAYEAVFHAIAEVGGLDIVVNWEALADDGIEPATELHLTSATALDAFNELMAARPDAPRLAFRYRNGGVLVATQRHFDKLEVRLVAYDLSPVLVDPDNLQDAIRSFVDPDEWIDNGGDLAQMRALGDRLLVEAPARMHPKIAWIIEQAMDDAAADAAPERAAGTSSHDLAPSDDRSVPPHRADPRSTPLR